MSDNIMSGEMNAEFSSGQSVPDDVANLRLRPHV